MVTFTLITLFDSGYCSITFFFFSFLHRSRACYLGWITHASDASCLFLPNSDLIKSGKSLDDVQWKGSWIVWKRLENKLIALPGR